MDRKLSDEQLDRLAKNLLTDFALDDATLDEIAESPKLWWSVKNRIETEKTRREKTRFAFFGWQIPVFGALAILLCVGLTAWFFNSRNDSNLAANESNPVQLQREEKVESTVAPVAVSSSNESEKPLISKDVNSVPRKMPAKNAGPKVEFVAQNQNREIAAKPVKDAPKKEISPKTAVEETKTDFIALSYAANTESGQIVRVKVPSSMMVSLGVATNVDKESEMVSAEVVIGDDGLARAIRFIR